jgi:hypothetical protein
MRGPLTGVRRAVTSPPVPTPALAARRYYWYPATRPTGRGRRRMRG